MKKLKLFSTVVLAICCYYNVNSQSATIKTKDKVVKSGSPGIVSLGGGLSKPISDFKDYAYAVNSSTFNADLFLPFFKKGWNGSVKGNKRSIGLNFGGAYTFGGNGTPTTTLPSGFAVTGATTSTIAYKGTEPRSSGFTAGIGPQANFYLGKLVISPMVLGEYFSITQKEISAVQTTVVGEQSYDFNLVSMPETKISGFAVSPKLRLQYMISQNFGFFADASYTLGPKAEITTSQLLPLGKSDAAGSYDIQQLQAGTQEINEPKSTAFNALGVNFGLAIAFGNSKKGNENHQSSNENNTPSITIGSSNKNCIEYKAPEIITTNQFQSIQLDKKNLNIKFIPSNAIAVNYKVSVWKENKGKKELIHDAIYPRNFNGSIKNLKLDTDKSAELSVQMQAVSPSKENSKPIKGDKAAFQKAQCSTFKNNGVSNTATFIVSNVTPCSPSYSSEITKVECIENGKIKVTGTYSMTLPPGKTGTLSIDSWDVLVDGVSATISNQTASINPMPVSVTSASIVNFSFELEGGDACDKALVILYNMHYAIDCGGGHIMESNIPCLVSYESLPCCICNYCDKPENMNIINSSQSATVSGDNLAIQQQINVTPKNISKITAEIVSIKENEIDEECRTCRKNQQGQLLENEVYHFIASNTAQWSTGITMPASSGNSGATFPSKILEWSTNNKGNIDFNLSLALPGTVSCCERHGVICVRYSFTDIECKTCSILVCYTY